MEVFTRAATQMLILFILIFLGALARRLRLMDDRFSTMLSQLVLNITLPATILSSVLNSTELPAPDMIGTIMLVSLIVYVLTCIFAFIVSKLIGHGKPKAEQGSHAFIMAFGNVGFMGFPILESVFGGTAVLYGAIYNIVFNLAIFTVGIAMISQGQENDRSQKPSLKHRLKALAQSVVNPCLVFSALSVVLALANVTDVGGVVGTACSYVGQMTVPSSMLVIGCNLAKMSPKSMLGHVRPYLSSAVRLIVVPLLMFVLFRGFLTDATMLGVVVICSGMPVASLGAMLAMVHGGDVPTIMRGTFISTVASLVTIPLLCLLLA